jgi:hypothetical protein
VAIDDIRREKVLAQVAQGATLRRAARATGISERSVRRFAAEPRFRQTLASLRSSVIEQIRDDLLESAHEALIKVRELVGSEDERVALAAAKTILDHVLPARLQIDTGGTTDKSKEFSEDDLHELLGCLGSSPDIANPADLETYRRYREALEEAQKDPQWFQVPDDYMAGAEEDRRLSNWRRHAFPAVYAGWLTLLKLVGSLPAGLFAKGGEE